MSPKMCIFVSISRNSSDSYGQTRVSDIKNKTIEQLVALRDIGLNKVSLGVESGDDWTLQRIDKGYRSADILEPCHKLEEAGIAYWVTFLNGVAGREHSRDHAINSAAGREDTESR